MQINKEPECEIIKKQMRKTQKDWVEYFNSKNTKMISAPDIYKVTNKEIIESLNKDFKENWEVTSTRIIYNKDNPNAEIIHNVESNVVKPNKYKIKVPVLDGDFKQDSEIEKYLQALFDTKDSIDKILKVLKKFGKDRKLRLWTPSQSSRKDKQVRSVVFFFGGFGRFGVGGYGWFVDVVGFSRGVIVDSAKQTRFFSNKAIFDVEEETIIIPMKKTLIKEIEKKQSKKQKVKISWDLKVKLK
ncbi:hypothetical protein LCGC14_2038540 [marine sediment metagenome]|uniref:Uncharacterized protein n=1 Tax=marine sediment metagenome TaxID=412755 RepID=A0A0F9H608_9ZZZZ